MTEEHDQKGSGKDQKGTHARKSGVRSSRRPPPRQASKGVTFDESIVDTIQIIDNVADRPHSADPDPRGAPSAHPSAPPAKHKPSAHPSAPPAKKRPSTKPGEALAEQESPTLPSATPAGQRMSPPPVMPLPNRRSSSPSNAPQGSTRPALQPVPKDLGLTPPPGLIFPVGKPISPVPRPAQNRLTPSPPPERIFPIEPTPSATRPSSPAAPIQQQPTPGSDDQEIEETILTPPKQPTPTGRPLQKPGPGRAGVYTIDIPDEDVQSKSPSTTPPPISLASSPTPAKTPAPVVDTTPVPVRPPTPEISETPSSPAPDPCYEPETLDPLIPEVEQLMSRGQWETIIKTMGNFEDAKRLPPNLQLLYGIARRETAGDRETTTDTDMLAISAMSQLLGVSSESPIAMMVTKRALRGKRPWAAQKASGSFSIILAFLGIGLGVLAGYFYTVFF